MTSEMRVLIVAGGTGGHLFPALHIARALKRADSKAVIEFVGTGRPLEAKIIDAKEFKLHTVPSVGVNGRGLRGIIEFIITLPRTLLVSWGLLSRFKPNVVVGVGGYVTVAPVLLAWLRGIATLIHEAEICPGLANRVLARFVNAISVSFDHCGIQPRKKVFYAGQPVRPEIAQFENAPLHRPERLRNILVMGGSLGAKALDRAFAAIAPAFKQRGLSIRHQARSESIDFLRRAYDEQLLHAEVVPFIEDVIAAYTWADLIVARAGASTVVELALVNRPVIFVPLKARGDHQILNARVMVEQGKALMVAEGDDFERRLLEAIDFYIDQQNYMRCVEAPMHQRNADGAERIARAVILGVKRVPIN